MNDCWQLKANFKKKIPEHFNYWLFEVEKLGAALKSLMPVSALTKLAQFDGVMADDERLLLKTDDHKCHIRLVKHCNEAQAIVLARTIIPRKTYQRYRHIIDHLGHQSIGEHFLFQSSMVTRSAFYVRNFPPSALYYRFPEQDFDCGDKTWARASIFCLESSYRLLIAEFFLHIPALNDSAVYQ